MWGLCFYAPRVLVYCNALKTKLRFLLPKCNQLRETKLRCSNVTQDELHACISVGAENIIYVTLEQSAFKRG